MTYRHQAGYGLTFLANYTYSRVMDLGQDVDQNSHIIDPFNVRSLYGPAGYDIRHVFKISYAWNLPWFASGGGIGGHFARGWTFSGIARAGSGLPLNISSGVDNSLTGYGLDHANQIGSWQLSGGRSRGQQVQEWFNTQAFTANPIGTFGNVGQNSVWAPGAFTFDMSIFRAFRLGERFKLEYRLDASNIFNHTVLTAVNGTASSSAFGAVTSTGNPRILQMALRLTF
jgi:hypothetical protein